MHLKFIWTNRMRVHFEEILQKPETEITNIESTMYMSLYYGVMYVVVEYWEALELHDDKIDQLLSSPNKKLLCDYRNASFHYNRKYFDKRFEKFFLEESTVNWILSLRNEFSRWFLENLKSISDD